MISNFSGFWTSAVTCDNASYPYRWSVNLQQTGAAVTGTITFHNCPGGGVAVYNVSGTATSSTTLTLSGVKFTALGDLGNSTPGSVTFTLQKNGAPNPNFAP